MIQGALKKVDSVASRIVVLYCIYKSKIKNCRINKS